MYHLQIWKRGYILLYKFIVRLVYILFSSIKKLDQNKVVIALYRTNELEGNLKFVYDEVIKQLPNAKIHLIFGENKMNLRLFKEIIMFSNARYLILDDYYLPIYLIRPKSDLKVIQLWHAAGALKKFGYSTVGTKFGPDPNYLKLVPIHSNYTHVYVSSHRVVQFYAEAFNMLSKGIFPIGVPRTDLFRKKGQCNEIVKGILSDFPILKEEKKVNILLAPTYRAKGSQVESSFEIVHTIIKVSKQLENNKRIIFKPHPYMNNEEMKDLKGCSNIFLANKYSINEWMLISDAFVTDYSSSVFEFALLNRPIAHFIPDVEEYEHNRGFYQDISVVSDGLKITDSYQLVKWINERETNENFDTSCMVHYNFDNIEDVSKKIVNHFINK